MKELTTIQARLHAPKDMTNKFANFQYRNAEGILRSVKPLLEECRCHLVLSDEVVLIGDRFYVKATATILNAEGQSESAVGFAREQDKKPGNDEAQVTGGCSSYARKYALCGLLAIDDSSNDPDVDSGKEETKAKRTTAKKPVTDEDENLKAAIESAKNARTLEELKGLCDLYRAAFGKNQAFVRAVTDRNKELNEAI